MQQIIPEDLLKFGLIPEFIGRLPIMAALEKLTEDDLVHILTQPKNALVKQYKKLLELDGVELVFEDDALRSIAKKALERNTGARGLRSIIENIMLDIMFDIPSRDDVVKCVITDNIVNGIGAPMLFDEDGKQIN